MDAAILSRAASCWGVPVEALTQLAGGHFAQVFGFSQAGCDYVLRVTPPDPSLDLPATQAMLAFQHALLAQGAPVPGPVRSCNGQWIEAIPDPENPGGGLYLATVFIRAQGMLAEEYPFEQWDDHLIENLGRAVGRLHCLSRAYTGGPERPNWQEISNCYHPLDELAAAADPSAPHHWVLEKRDAALAQIERLPKTPDCYAIVHADLHFGNIFIDVEQRAVTFLDFDDCAWGWLVMDIAMNLLDALVLYSGPDREAFARRFLDLYLAGYRSENPLDAAWVARLPLFLKLLETSLYLQVADYYDPQDVDSWVGRFMAGRRENIEQDRPFVRLETM